MTTEIDALKRQIEALLSANARLEAKLEAYREMLAMQQGGGAMPPPPHRERAADPAVYHALASMSRLMHCALQMILRGATNQEIADKLGITESAAKVHVRGVMKKLGVNSRHAVIAKAKSAFDAMPPDEYERLAGIPKDWSERP